MTLTICEHHDMSIDHRQRQRGYQWRSSQTFIVAVVSFALFGETFMYGFLVPLLSYMLETRLHRDPSQTQSLTATLLSTHGITALISAPIFAHFADKTPNRKLPLVMSLLVCIIGTTTTASTLNLPSLFLGRLLQGLSSSAAWIVCFSTLANNVDQAHMGKAMGVAMSFVTAGVMTGPILSGAMFQTAGYWPSWSFPLAVLVLDLAARLVMLEDGDFSTVSSDTSTSFVPLRSLVSVPIDALDSDNETTPPLAVTSRSYEWEDQDQIVSGEERTEKSSLAFYRIMLQDTRVMIGVANTIAYSGILAGFNATLPLHLYQVFHWGTRSVGLIFLTLQIPNIILGPAVGMLRDRIGLRTPTAAGWLVLSPLIWLLGFPGERHIIWLSPDRNSTTAILIACMTCVGIVLTLLRSVGTLQLTAVVHKMQTENPKIFGEHGAYSRVSSISEMSFNLGLAGGPLLASWLVEMVGYYYMNVILAGLCFLMANLCFFLLR